MYEKCTSNSQINTKNVQTVQNLYKVQTKNSLKLEMDVFCTYKQCTNYTKCIVMLIKLYMQLLMYVFCIYKTSTFFTFQIVASTTPSSILFPIFSYSKRFTDDFI